MKKLMIAAAVVALSTQAGAQGFLQNLQKQLNQAAAGGGAGGGGAAGGNSSGGMADLCPGYAPFKKKDLAGGTSEAVVAKYFKTPADLERILLNGIGGSYLPKSAGTMAGFDRMLEDIKDKEIKKLGQSFVANPSVDVLSQIVIHAERGDGFANEREPSELAEAQTLLAMVMMQYPNLTLNSGEVVPLLKQASMKNSGLAYALLARIYLFGDYAPRDINSFSGYVAQASNNYPVKMADRTIFLALEKMPSWQYRNQYLNLLQSSQQMQQSFQRQQAAARTTDTFQRAVALMREGEKIDQLTLDALGAGPKIAELRAKGEMLRKEGKGESNLIEVEVNQSAEYQQEVARLIATNPKLTDAAKAKLESANKLKVANVSNMRSLTAEVALKFFSGDIGATMESGALLNRYYHNSCNVAVRQIDLSKQIGVPQPTVSAADLAKGSL